MSEVLRRLRSLGDELARELGFELVQVQFIRESGQWYLRFSLDKPGGINVVDCEKFSRRIESLIDADDPIPHQYILEVSSAGLDRPLLREADYERFAGRQITVKLYEPIGGRRRFDGKLHGLTRVADETSVDLEIDGGARVTLPLGKVAQARLVPDL